MRKNFAKSVLFITTIIICTAFTNQFSAQTKIDDLVFSSSKSNISRVSAAIDQFFAGDGSALNANKYANSAAGPFTDAFVSGNIINFGTPNGTGTGASVTVGGFNAIENFTLTSVNGTISNASNGVVPITVASGKLLDFSTQGFTGSSTAGYIKNGAGVLAFSGGTYGGGFTLNNGTVIARGVNTFGGNTTTPGSLTINAGAIGANANRDFSNKYSGIIVGGDFQLGVLSSAVSISSDTANLIFNSPVALGAATRTITIGANGNYTFSGVISGALGSGLTVTNLAGTTGRITLSGVNTYNGNTTINGGTLALSGAGSIAQSSVITVAGGATFDVSALTTPLTLMSGQGLTASGTTSSGTIATSVTNGLTLASDSPLKFTAFNGSTPPLTITGAGTIALQSTNPVTVTVSNGGTPLGAGDYTLISKGISGGVTGTAPTSLTVNGDGIAMGNTASLQIVNGSLILHVLGTTAAAVNVGGRVTGAKGRGISGALVTMTEDNGNSYSAQTDSSGYYLFEGVEVGQTLIFNVRAKRYNFTQPMQVVSLTGETITVNFTGYESKRIEF